MATGKSEIRTLTLRQQKGRAINAVADLLRKTLSVPNIYIEPRHPYIFADVLAVDRAGAGDLHAVEIRIEDDLKSTGTTRKPANTREANEQNVAWLERFRKRLQEIRSHVVSLAAHFKYLAVSRDTLDMVMGELGSGLYPDDGIGRIGIIAVTYRGNEPPVAEIVIAPERFRVQSAKLQVIERNILEKVRPDIEVRI